MALHDYLFKFLDEQAAKLALADWHHNEAGWVPKYQGAGVMPVSIVAQERGYDNEQEQIISDRIDVPGFWLVISTMDTDNPLYDMPECVQETIRPESPTPVSGTIRRTKLQADEYAAFIRVDPVFAGALYIWGQ